MLVQFGRNTSLLKKIATLVTVTALISTVAFPLFAFPQTARADAPSVLRITCDAVVQNGTSWTFSGTWTAIDFPGQSSSYDAALFSPSGTLKDGSSKSGTGDTFVATSTPNSNFAGASNKNDMQGTWSNTETFASAPTSVNAVLYHQGVPGNESSSGADGFCSFAPLLTKGGLVVNKVLVNDNGGTQATTSFSFTIPGVNAGNPISFLAGGSNSFSLNAGSYTVTETAAPGYVTTYSPGCTATVTAGATTTCTITNNDIAPSLTLNKILIRNNGGSASESDWTLTATGPTTISGPGALGTNDVVSGPTFKAGTYTLSESTGPAGYAASSWSCTNGVTVNGSNQITLGLGQSTVCSITNDDIGPKLSVTKILNYTHGGTKLLQDFILLVDSLQVTSGAQNTFNTGSYIVGEVATPGYTGVIGGNCAPNGLITLGLGDVKNCTITNSDVAPSLTLTKTVVGGPNTAADWTLTATGPTPLSGQTPVASGSSFVAGTYALSETASGTVSPYYVASSWMCTGGTQDGSNITLAVGQTVSCSITNTYTPPVCDDGIDNDGDGFVDFPADIGCVSPTDTNESNENTLALCTDGIDNDSDSLIDFDDADCTAFIPKLTVVKNLINDSNIGGTKSNTDFSFQVNGGSATAFPGGGSVTLSMPVGSYTVTEVAAPGYTTSYSTDCTGSIAAGQTKTCTITNDDKPTTITVVKNLILDSGKVATTSDFSFTVSDGEDTSTYSFGETGSVTLSVMPSATYQVTEVAAPGYATSYAFGETLSCSGISLQLGESAQCVITNNDLPACSDGIDNDTDGVSDIDDPGCHSDLNPENSESYMPNAQSEGNESTLALCTDGKDNDNDEMVDMADSDCAPFMPHLIVKKVIVNDNSGIGNYSMFKFKVNGGEPNDFNAETGETVLTVEPGTYTVTEVQPAGYSVQYEGCTEITLAAGETKTCVITNNDLAPETPSTPPSSGGGGGGGNPNFATFGGAGGSVLGASTGQVLGASCGVYMDKYVRLGKRNSVEQVKKLQAFLNKYQSAGLPITGVYGPLTLAAVNAFQAKHADSILAPWNIKAPTGIVYRTTLRQINMVECPDIVAGNPELVEWSKAKDPAKPE